MNRLHGLGLAASLLLGLTTAVIADDDTQLTPDPDPKLQKPVVIEGEPAPIPDDKPELIKPEPGKEYVWVPGSWEREPGKWVWVEGRWAKPPLGQARWVDGYWKHDHDRYHWHPGHWAIAQTGWIVEKPVEPPPLPAAEPMPAAPSPQHRWVHGHWDWNGVWVYVPGHFTLKPDPQAVWVAGHWEQGLLGRYRWISGHWKVEKG